MRFANWQPQHRVTKSFQDNYCQLNIIFKLQKYLSGVRTGWIYHCIVLNIITYRDTLRQNGLKIKLALGDRQNSTSKRVVFSEASIKNLALIFGEMIDGGNFLTFSALIMSMSRTVIVLYCSSRSGHNYLPTCSHLNKCLQFFVDAIVVVVVVVAVNKPFVCFEPIGPRTGDFSATTFLKHSSRHRCLKRS